MESEIIYVNSEFIENMKALGVGLISYIEVYKREKDKIFFKAGRGKFHVTPEELEEIRIPAT